MRALPLVIAVLLAAAPARAEGEWYGAKIAIIDGASMLLFLTGRPPLMVAGGAGYLLGGPVVHGFEGQGASAAGSLGLRVALPVLGTFIGAAAAPRCQRSEDCFFEGVGYAATGLGIGALSAVLLDSLWLANHRNDVQVALLPAPRGLALAARF